MHVCLELNGSETLEKRCAVGYLFREAPDSNMSAAKVLGAIIIKPPQGASGLVFLIGKMG
jgi:hypothetical protein